MATLTVILIAVMGWAVGVISLLGYLLYRMMKNPGWDDSNITNALRLLSHVTLHPEDFGMMWYLKWNEEHTHLVPEKRPFWYVDQDELGQVVQARP